MAARLEEALNEDLKQELLDQLANNLWCELQQLKESCGPLLNINTNLNTVSETDWQVVTEILSKIEPLLNISSMQANVLVSAHANTLKATLGTIGSDLEHQIAHFLYPEALETLQKAKSQLASNNEESVTKKCGS